MTIQISPIVIDSVVEGSFPIEVALQETISISPIIGGVGIKGDSANNKYLSGGAISGHSPVYVGLDGNVSVCAASDVNSCRAFAGVTLNASILGEWTEVVTDGIITHSGWSWVVDGAVYIGDGVLTQVVPTSGAIAIIGYAVDETTLLVKPQPVIHQSSGIGGRYLGFESGGIRELSAINAGGGGEEDAGKLVSTGPTGVLDLTLLPEGINADTLCGATPEQLPVSLATSAALEAKADLESPVFTGTPSIEARGSILAESDVINGGYF